MKYIFKLYPFVFILACSLLSAQNNKDALTKEEILEAYYKNQGGLPALEKINSIRVKGTLETQNDSFEFIEFKKRPHFTRLNLIKGRNEISMGYNGEIAWQYIAGTDHTSEIPEEAANDFIRNAKLFTDLFEYAYNQEAIHYHGEEIIDTHVTYHMSIDHSPLRTTHYYISKNTFLDYKIVRVTKDNEGNSQSVSMLLSSYKEVPPLQQAFHLETYINDKLDTVFRIKNVKINPGIFNSYFTPPKSLKRN